MTVHHQLRQRTFLATVTIFASCIFVLWSLYYYAQSPTNPFRTSYRSTLSRSSDISRTPPPGDCTGMMKDTMVTMKTGGTVTFSRLPMHLDTTLRCLPHLLIVSDLEVEIGSYRTIDVVADLDNQTLQHNDFRLYKAQRERLDGRAELSSLVVGANGWDLDKYKFIPMIRRAWLQGKDNSNIKWFLFIEDDTAVHWDNIRRLLDHYNRKINPRRNELFLGSLSLINDQAFAHGGSGYVLSRKAMEVTVGKSPDNWLAKWGPRARDECCGDFLLGKALEEEGNVKVKDTYPFFSGYSVASADFHDGIWCHAFATMHHTSNQFVANLWSLGSEASRRYNRAAPTPLRWRDIYFLFVKPHLSENRTGWYNFAKDYLIQKISDADWCRQLCLEKEKCLQWYFFMNDCSFSERIILGEMAIPSFRSRMDRREPVSGWMLDRISKFEESHKTCTTEWSFI